MVLGRHPIRVFEHRWQILRWRSGSDAYTYTDGDTHIGRSGPSTAVWTGIEVIVWGGVNSILIELNTGGRYYPAIDAWTATSTANAPRGRTRHTAVWTGSEMIAWGGSGCDSNCTL